MQRVWSRATNLAMDISDAIRSAREILSRGSKANRKKFCAHSEARV
jgi:hypothetical protein